MKKIDRGYVGLRSSVIPRTGGLHGTLSRFMPSQAIVSRFSSGPDVRCTPTRTHGLSSQSKKGCQLATPDTPKFDRFAPENGNRAKIH